ncbi:hypothetical protein [Adhaeribacter arboris]|uniref:hypothetical protein n=1 Tax=Adhaeribacter arboris TaxID=2072846 RepID=UPI001304FEB7|nr:hypothetical protein [Adhaeribacter arboris]
MIRLILEETKACATALLTEKVPAATMFFTLEHTKERIKSAEKLHIKVNKTKLN